MLFRFLPVLYQVCLRKPIPNSIFTANFHLNQSCYKEFTRKFEILSNNYLKILGSITMNLKWSLLRNLKNFPALPGKVNPALKSRWSNHILRIPCPMIHVLRIMLLVSGFLCHEYLFSWFYLQFLLFLSYVCFILLLLEYLNNPAVQKALHVSQKVNWTVCNDLVFNSWPLMDYMGDTTSLYSYIYNHPNKPKDFKMLVYSGDSDGVSNAFIYCILVWCQI